MYYASRSARGLFCSAVHGISIPADAVPLSAIRYAELLHGQSKGKVIDWDDDGVPILVDPPERRTTVAELCERVDAAADATRRRCAGDPLRALERDRAPNAGTITVTHPIAFPSSKILALAAPIVAGPLGWDVTSSTGDTSLSSSSFNRRAGVGTSSSNSAFDIFYLIIGS